MIRVFSCIHSLNFIVIWRVMMQEKSRAPPPSPPPEHSQAPAPPQERTEDGKLMEKIRAEICLVKEEMKEEMRKQLAQQTVSVHGPVVSIDSC